MHLFANVFHITIIINIFKCIVQDKLHIQWQECMNYTNYSVAVKQQQQQQQQEQ